MRLPRYPAPYAGKKATKHQKTEKEQVVPHKLHNCVGDLIGSDQVRFLKEPRAKQQPNQSINGTGRADHWRPSFRMK
jgi:hypothetical protein